MVAAVCDACGAVCGSFIRFIRFDSIRFDSIQGGGLNCIIVLTRKGKVTTPATPGFSLHNFERSLKKHSGRVKRVSMPIPKSKETFENSFSPGRRAQIFCSASHLHVTDQHDRSVGPRRCGGPTHIVFVQQNWCADTISAIFELRSPRSIFPCLLRA